MQPIHKQPPLAYILKIVIAMVISMALANLLPDKLQTLYVVWCWLGLIAFPITDPNLPLWKYFMYSPIIGIYEILDRIYVKYLLPPQ